jgi:dihydroorotase
VKILIKEGRVIDPANKIDKVADVLIENGRIAKVAQNFKAGADRIIDAKGKIVIPGLVDMHTHLREPGREDKETVASATKAALKGGITCVLAMPNTNPTIDCKESASLLKNIIQKTANCNVNICGSITHGRQGKVLSNFIELKRVGAVAISDDGSSVDSDGLMLRAFKSARQQKILVICHSEDKTLSKNGVVNLGFTSTRMGLRGISNGSEYKRVERDIKLAQEANCPVHIAHVSCKESIEIIAKAKKKGIKVSAETAPHYFSLNEEAVLGYDTNMKMNPPLRSKEDMKAIQQALKNGIIDTIASDHAPHTENEKDIEFEHAEFGVVGLETELAVAMTELVGSGILSFSQLIEKMSLNPARILGLDKGTLSVGACADIVILSPDKEWMVEKQGLVSKSKNSAFLGKKLKGWVDYTICAGKIAYRSS